MSERYANGWAVPRPTTLHEATRDDQVREIPASRLLREPPRRNWMVENVFLRSTVAMITGDGGKGKSLLMQQLCTSAVMGFDWLGMKLQRGKALFFACEDDGDELHRRQWSINQALGCSMEDVCEAGLELVPRVGQDNALMTLERKSWRMRKSDSGLLDGLVKRCATHGIQYLIIDTATKTFRGNQNDDTMVDDYITEFRKIAVMMQGIVIFTKHPSMNGRALGTGESGSVAWVNSVRAYLYLHAEKPDGLVLEGRKANYGPNAPKIPLRWDRGVFNVAEAAPPARWTD